MREKNRKPIASYIKLPQFTTMNVIDGQAGLIIYASLIFYSLTIDNILNIIVLLILAGVTIATLTGDNGLLTKASGARDTSTEAEIEEKLRLAYQDYYLGQHTQSGYTFQNAVDKMFGEGVATVTEANGVYKVAFTNGKKYTFNALTKEVAELEEIWTQNGTTVTNTKTGQVLEVGDTVYYDSGVEEYEGTGDNQGKWFILGAEDGNLLIMSKDKVGTLYLSGKDAYLTGSTQLNNLCTPFKNADYADLARAPKAEDIYRITNTSNYITTGSYVYSMDGDYVKRNDLQNSSKETSFEDVYGNTLEIKDSINVEEKRYAYVQIPSGLKSRDFLNGFILDSFGCQNTVEPSYMGGNYYVSWGLCCMSYNALYLYETWRSTGTSMDLWGSGSSGVKAVIALKSSIKLTGSSEDGWTISK